MSVLALIDIDGLLFNGGVVALVLTLVFAAAFRARRRREFRARVFEVLARAVARDLPLAPLFRTAAGEFRGRECRALNKIHGALMGGACLSDAFAIAGRRMFPRDLVGSIRAAEGTGGLPPVLDANAADATAGHLLRHRVILALLYPALLLFVMWAIQTVAVGLLDEVRAALETNHGARLHAFARTAMHVALAVVPVVLGMWWLLNRLHLTPGARLRRRARTRRSLAALVSAGVSLPDALRRCGCANEAAQVEAGESAVDYSPGKLAAEADDCMRRYHARVDRLVYWLNPAAILLTALLAALVLLSTFRMIDGVRLEVWPW